MNHPILATRNAWRWYVIIWGVITMLHWLILHLVFHINPLHAAIDSIVYNGLMMLLGLGIWYPVAYSGVEKGWLTMLSQLSLAAVVIVGMWLMAGNAITNWIVPPENEYHQFVAENNVMRAVIGTLFFSLYVLVFYLHISYQNLQTRIRQTERMNSLLQEAELKALKAQLNPHFLFNSLNSISALTIVDQDAAREMVNKLSDFLRYSLRKNHKQLLPLEEELRNMRRYLDIEKVRFGDRLICDMKVPEACKKMHLPAMILQPIFENAVKHGVYESTEEVSIRSFCRETDDALEVSIINNYDPKAPPRRGEGVGLKIVKERLKMIYNRDDLLNLTRENNFFEVTMRFPQV
ncbi:histidine kinase [Marinilabiliaceae bacterium JC017]|nr:histidine kinase [Marinilabiliaceae bacterium JC017]